MQINHSFDVSPEIGAEVEVLHSASYFALEPELKDGGFDCAGTFGSAGSFGGTLGTVGCFGCCC